MDRFYALCSVLKFLLSFMSSCPALENQDHSSQFTLDEKSGCVWYDLWPFHKGLNQRALPLHLEIYVNKMSWNAWRWHKLNIQWKHNYPGLILEEESKAVEREEPIKQTLFSATSIEIPSQRFASCPGQHTSNTISNDKFLYLSSCLKL
jgi:hypothetical protein